MSSPTPFAVIGVGHRLRSLVSLLLHRYGNEVRLEALSDEVPEVLSDAQQQFGSSIATHTDYHELLDSMQGRWVLIGSKNYLHRDHCIAAFTVGKSVFCEKPLAITIDQCDDIRQAHRAAGTPFAIGFVLRYAHLYRQIKDIVARGELGKIVSFEANEYLSPDHGGYIMRNWRRFRRFSGPHFLEKCSHDIDILNWIIGSVPTRVASFGGRSIFTPENQHLVQQLSRPDDDPPLYRGWHAWEDVDPFSSDKDIYDHQVSLLEYRTGVQGTFSLTLCAAFPQRRMALIGLEGTLEADFVAGTIRVQRIGRSTKEHRYFFPYEEHNHGGADDIIVDDIYKMITTDKQPDVTGEEGFASALVCFALDEACEKNTIVDLEPYWERFGL